MENLPAYLKQLKFSPKTIIGLRIYAQPAVIKNPCGKYNRYHKLIILSRFDENKIIELFYSK